VDFDESRESLDGGAVDTVVLASYRDGQKDGLVRTIGDAVDRQPGSRARTLTHGVLPPMTARFPLNLDVLTSEGASRYLGYMLHDGYLMIGNTGHLLASVVTPQNGDPDAPSADDEYQRTMEFLPAF
jgi:hypothetical protein